MFVPPRERIGSGKVNILTRHKHAAPPLPLAGEGWGGGGVRETIVVHGRQRDSRRVPTRLALARNCAAELGTLRASFARLDPRKREREDYGAAVVTPPSTTIVWPVMKVEASEAR